MGWTGAQAPGPRTQWTADGARLTPTTPVTLSWDNGAGQVFRRSFTVDDNYLFTIGHSLENNGEAAFTAAPYGIIARHGQPDTQNFFVLHEGAVLAEGSLDHVTSNPQVIEVYLGRGG